MNEKEAIETYKNFLDDISKNGGYTIDIDFQHKKEYEAMWKILDILKEQQEEIEKYKMLLLRTNAQFINDTIETDKKNKEDLEMLYNGCQAEMETLKRDFEIVDHECSRLEKADIKKDMIIDLMAEQLVKAHEWFYSEFDNYTKEDFVKYFNQKIEKGE